MLLQITRYRSETKSKGKEQIILGMDTSRYKHNNCSVYLSETNDPSDFKYFECLNDALIWLNENDYIIEKNSPFVISND
jgi:hypothetical protein